MRDLTIKDSGTYQCVVDKSMWKDIYTPVELKVKKGFPASTVITVSVILLLFLIGTIILLVVFQKRQKLQGSASTPGRRSVKDTGNNQGVPLDVCEYEEIKDTRRLSASESGNSTIYAMAHLPTSPCDSAVYSTAQLPTIPSDQDIYSNAQLPTRLSAGESAEDLNYTTVSFHTKSTSSNDADSPKIIFKKAEVSCEYDSISHVTSSG
ncbi:hypothetical protein KOW79_009608 [Hemibagrus wyckioides]|uniref:Uncharacterized protein n=1 Tax=Hemibagrus wyckioides TaxID=337641 RepID=A0A9D3NSN4_9TELE|nr:hypothetical protein KOW79_009608 [Hemibagrus wyckioides]